jgi:phospholipid transport system transporter-binding protein
MTTIALPERLTIAEARATLARLEPLLQAADAPVLDASALRELDTSAVAVLLDCQRQAHARGLKLQISGAPPKLAQLAQLYGVEGLLAL